jgi:hypothetical protein
MITSADLVEEVRSVCGITDDVDITDADLEFIINISLRHVINELFLRHWEEELIARTGGIPVIDGTNKKFFVQYPPIGDYNNDGAVSGSDVTVRYLDANEDWQDATVVVTDARSGELEITTDGTIALPNTTLEVKIDYWSYFREYNERVVKDAVLYLSAHYTQLRITEPDKISLRDLESSNTIIRIMPTRFWLIYKDLLRQEARPKMRVF